MTSSLTT